MTETPPPEHEEVEAVNALGRHLLSDVAPGELPLFSAVAQAQRSGVGRKQSSGGNDDLLGFGVGEAVVMVAPFVLEFAQQVWTAVAKEASTATAGGVVAVLRRMRERFAPSKDKPPAEPVLTTSELQYVREVGRECAARMPLSADQQRQMIESLVAALAVPEKPDAVPT